jgi:hypothetical protein
VDRRRVMIMRRTLFLFLPMMITKHGNNYDGA